jgi:glutamine amidotransferase
MAGLVERLGRDAGVEWPLQMTLGLSDGERLYAVRYSTEGISRTLYHSEDMAALRRLLPPEDADALDDFSDESRVVVSEPLGHEIPHMWEEIPEATFVVAEAGRIEERPFEPRGV